jgi:methylmalonyl-CoA/ethylmalonyl-CoA epimerase
MVIPASQQFALHHVGILVRDIATVTTDFVARLGYRVESNLIEDPTQTAYVVFLRQPESSSWLELITPNSTESKLMNALRKGGGLHHLCYEVPQMRNACEHLRNQTMFMVAPPTPATAFPGRQIAWFMDQAGLLVELLECSDGALSLNSIADRSGRAAGEEQ